VSGDGTDPTAVLDGFTISHGIGAVSCDSGSPTFNDCTFASNVAYGAGAAMHNYNAGPILNNCIFIGNMAIGYEVAAGAMLNEYSNPKLTGCTFRRNEVSSQWWGGGGAIWNRGGSPVFRNCTFENNRVDVYEWELDGCDGGAILSDGGELVLIECAFYGNYAFHAGGAVANVGGAATVVDCTFINNDPGAILNWHGSAKVTGSTFTGNSGGMGNYGNAPLVTNCVFRENGLGMGNEHSQPVITGCVFTENRRGGMWNKESQPVIRGCIFTDNWTERGGGMYNDNSESILINCIFSGNSAMSPTAGDGAIYERASSTFLRNCTFAGNYAVSGSALYLDEGLVESTNCIFWDISDKFFNHEGVITIVHSDIRGGWPGPGNIDADPCFAALGYWDLNGTPEYIYDDFWVDGDYHLKSQAGRWDPNEGRWAMDEVTSPCIDAGDPMSAIGLEPFPNGGIVNMGAYGGIVEASKSYFEGPPCDIIVAGDINGDCVINFLDFQLMAVRWYEDNNP
ncbi:MAG: right-handed parallel beta-helix repeat-containing protein, partial [Planctomycetota bacterium]